MRRLKIQLRKRWHNRPILAKVGSVIESDFIIRQLYKDVYFTDFYFLSISLFILLTICTVCVLSTLHKDHDDDDFRDANTTAARVCNSYSYYMFPLNTSIAIVSVTCYDSLLCLL